MSTLTTGFLMYAIPITLVVSMLRIRRRDRPGPITLAQWCRLAAARVAKVTGVILAIEGALRVVAAALLQFFAWNMADGSDDVQGFVAGTALGAGLAVTAAFVIWAGSISESDPRKSTRGLGLLGVIIAITGVILDLAPSESSGVAPHALVVGAVLGACALVTAYSARAAGVAEPLPPPPPPPPAGP